MVYIHVPRLAALLSSCVAFGLIIWTGRWDGEVGVLCVFCWTFSFTGSLLRLLMEMFTFHNCVRPEFWRDITMTMSSYAALFCLNASSIFPYYFLKGQKDNEFYNHRAVAEIFSCIATLGHLVEVWIMWTESRCCMATIPGLLQVCQTYVASAIFFFLANSVSFKDHPAVIWSLTVYCLCFICTFVNIICCALQNKRNQIWLKQFNLIAATMYLSASWPVFQLSKNLGQIVRPGARQGNLGLRPETRLTVVVALTALNFLLYLLSTCAVYEHGTRTSTSDVCPKHGQWEVLPEDLSRAIQPYNTTNTIQSMSSSDLRIRQNFYIQNLNVHIKANK